VGRWKVVDDQIDPPIPRPRENSEFIFVEFNAWLYQGYDDARAALMEVIASTLATEAEKRKKGVEKAKEFLERINWFRLAKLVAGSAVSLSSVYRP
jgi:predicted KAP-like P-loop ATPase